MHLWILQFMLDVHSCWLSTSAAIPGAPPDAFVQWENYYGVRLPSTLKALLGVHNGGLIERLGKEFRLLSLQEIGPLSELSIAQLLSSSSAAVLQAMQDVEVPVPWLMFPFLQSQDHKVHFLCFAEHSPKAEAWVYAWDHGCLKPTNQTVDDVLVALLQLSDFPAVDLREAAETEIVADESLLLRLDTPAGAVSELRQVLGRKNREWLLFTREVVTLGNEILSERRSRAVMPEPLHMKHSYVTLTRPPSGDFGGSWALPIEPFYNDQMVLTNSFRTRSGKWQSEELLGEPVRVLLESTNEERLVALHRALAGDPDAEKPSLLKFSPSQSARIDTKPAGPSLLRPNIDAITQSLRRMTELAIRSPRTRLSQP